MTGIAEAMRIEDVGGEQDDAEREGQAALSTTGLTDGRPEA
jgi:hypothetical protein